MDTVNLVKLGGGVSALPLLEADLLEGLDRPKLKPKPLKSAASSQLEGGGASGNKPKSLLRGHVAG